MSGVGPRTDLVGFANSGRINVTQLYVQNVPLANVATSGSASDLTTGVLPTSQVPGLDASKIISGQLSTSQLPPSSQSAASKTDVWTGFNSNSLSGTSTVPLGPGAYLGWNRSGQGKTGFANAISSSANVGGWEFISYNSDKSFANVAVTLSALGAITAPSIGNAGSGFSITDTLVMSGHGITGVASLANGGSGISVNENLALGGKAITGVASLANAGNGISIPENVALGGKALTGVASLANGGSAISIAAAVNFNSNALTGVASLANSGNGISIPENVAFGGKTLSGVAVLGNSGSGVTINDNLALAGGSLTGVGSLGLSQNLAIVNSSVANGTPLGLLFGNSSTAAGALTWTNTTAGATVALTNGGATAPGLRIVPSGALTGMGTGYLLMRAFNAAAAVANGVAPRFRGLPVDCQLVSAISQGETGTISVGPPNYTAITTNVQLRFAGYIQAPSAGSYSFQLSYQGSGRLWVNDTLLIDASSTSSNPSASGSPTASVTLPAAYVPIMVEFFSGASGGRVGVRVLQSSSSNYVAIGTVMSLAYDMYENPGSQFGTATFVNGIIGPSLSNNGLGIAITEATNFGTNALTGVTSIANGGSGLSISEITNFGGRALLGVASLANSGSGITTAEPLTTSGSITSSSILSFGQPAASPCLISLFATGLPSRMTTAFYGFGTGTNMLAYRVPASTQDHVFYAGTTELGRIKGTGVLTIATVSGVGTISNSGNGISIPEAVNFGTHALTGVASLANSGNGISITEAVNFNTHALTGVVSLANSGNGISINENTAFGGKALTGVASLANGGSGITVSEAVNFGTHALTGVKSLANGGSGISITEAVNFNTHALTGVASLANSGNGISVTEAVNFNTHALTGVASLANGGSGISVTEAVNFNTHALTGVASLANGGNGISIPENVAFGGYSLTGVSSITNGGNGVSINDTLSMQAYNITNVPQLSNAGSGITVADTLAVTGATSLSSTLAVTGASTLAALACTTLAASGATTLGSTLAVTGASTLAAVSCTTLAASGNSTIGGTLGVTGATSLSSALAVTGATTIGGSLGVSGASTLAGLSCTTATVSGNETVGGTLGVSGSSTFAAVSSTSLTNSGNESIGGTLAVTGASTLSGTLRVNGSSTLAAVSCSTLAASGATSLSSTLGVTGASTLAAVSCTTLAASGNSTVGGTLGISGTTTMAGTSCTSMTNSGNQSVGGTLGVTGASTLAALSCTTLAASGSSTLAGVTCTTLTTSGNTALQGTLSVTGASTHTGAVVINNTLTQSGNHIVSGGAASGAGPRIQVFGGGSTGSTTGIDISSFAPGTGYYPAWSLTGTDSGSSTDSLDLLQTVTGAASQVNRLHINASNGFIGLGGLTSPQYTLDVTGTIRATSIIVSASGSDTRNDPLDQSTVLQYTFRTGSGTAVADRSVSLNTGTISGNVTWSSANPFDGLRGTYLAFADATGAITPTSTIGSATMTATCWYSPSAFNTGGGGYNTLFFNASNRAILTVRASDGQVGFYNSGFTGCGYILTIGNWYHLAVSTYTVTSGSTTTVYTLLYVNARLQLTSTAAYSLATYPITLIGNTATGQATSAGQACTGRLADVRIWGRTLSNNEMEMVYSQTNKPVFRDVNTGYVGINTPSGAPVTTLDIGDNNAGSNLPFIRLNNLQGGQGNTVGLQMSPYSGRTGGVASQIHALDDGNSAAHLVFSTTPTGTASVLAERMRIANSGFVGIGQTVPGYLLDVNGTFRAVGNSLVGGTLGVTGATTMSTATVTGILSFNNLNASNNVNNQVICLYTQDSALSASSTNFYGFGLGSSSNLRYQAPAYPGCHTFYSAATEIMRANATGLGVFNASPAYPVDVTGVARASQLLVGNSTDTASYRAISALQSGLATQNGLYFTLGQSATNNNQAEYAFFYTGSGSTSNYISMGFYGSAATSRMYYTAGGMLGVGISTPGYTCDVAGTIRATGPAILGSTLAVAGILSVAAASMAVVVGSASTTTNASMGVLTNSQQAELAVVGAGGAGSYSTSSAAGDAVLRVTPPSGASQTRLLLQTGAGAAGIIINAANNVSVTNTFAVGGATSLAGTLAVTGASTLAAVSCTTLSATGATTLASVTCTSLAVNGNETVSGTLGVTGTTTMSTATVTGILSLNSQITNNMICLYSTDSPLSSSSTNFYGFGVNNSVLRYQVPASNCNHVWYVGTSEVMRANATGVGVFNGAPAYPVDVTGVARASQLLVGNSTDTASYRAISALQSGLATSNGLYFTLGQSATTNNQAEYCFTYIGSGSTSNYLSIGFYGGAATSRLYYTAGGLFGVGTVTPGYTCDVAGTIRATGAAILGSTLAVTGTSTMTGALQVNNTVTQTGNHQINSTAVAGGGTGSRLQVYGPGYVGATTGIDLSTYFPSASQPTSFALTVTDSGNVTGSMDLLQYTGSGTTMANRLHINASNGYIGLGGLTTPQYTLDVTGTVRATNILASGMFASDTRNDPLDQSTVLQYTFRAGSGTTANDRSVSQNAGTISGNFSWNSNVPFDGLRGTYLTIADGSAAIVPTSTIGSATQTASCWYSPASLAGQGSFGVLFCNGANRNLLCVRASDNQVGFYNSAFTGCGYILTTGNWYHLTVTSYVVVSGSTTTYYTLLYVNARLYLTSTSAFSAVTYPITCIGNAGPGNTASNGQASIGRLADVRIWGRALSNAEVEMVYGQTAKGVFKDVNTGYVGINLPSAAPAVTLDVGDTTSGSLNTPFIRLSNLNGGGGNTTGIQMTPVGQRTGGAASQIHALDDGNSAAHMVFSTTPTGTASVLAERMRIATSGFVGIGQTVPGYLLDVNGTFRAVGNSLIGGTLGVTGATTLSTLTTTGAVTFPAGGLMTGTFTFSTANGGSGLSWGLPAGSNFSQIYDDGDLRIKTDDNMHFFTNSVERITITTSALALNLPTTITGAFTSTGLVTAQAAMAVTGNITQAGGNHTLSGGSSGGAGPRVQLTGAGSSGATVGIDLSSVGNSPALWSITATDNGNFSNYLDFLQVPSNGASQLNRARFNAVNGYLGLGGQTSPAYTLDVAGGIRQSVQVFGQWSLTATVNLTNGGSNSIPGSAWSLSYGTFVNTSASAVLPSSGLITFPFKGLYTVTMQATFSSAANNYSSASYFVINTLAAAGLSGNTSLASRFGTDGSYGKVNALSVHTGVFAAGDSIQPGALSNTSGNSLATGGNTTLTVSLLAVLN